MTIGEKIKDARLKKRFTQEELASRVGVQKSAIAKWETGRVENIKRSSLQKLAEALEISPAELIGSGQEAPAISPVMKEITGILATMNDEQLAKVASYIRFIKNGG